MTKKQFSTHKDIILAKLKKYCAYRDRCHSEVRNKILKLEVYGDTLEEIISDLIIEGYLNEERYACSFARGKFRINHWGRTKIRQGLKAKQIPDSLIKIALEEIEEKEYLDVLTKLIIKKSNSLSEENNLIRNKKLITYAMGRGFEYDIIKEVINGMEFE